MIFTRDKIKYALKILPKMREVLQKEENWCQGAIARNKEGLVVSGDQSDAYSFCLVGAHRKVEPCYENRLFTTTTLLGVQASGFNDSAATTHEKILAKIDERIAFFKSLQV